MADLSPLIWREATITDIFEETPRVKTFRLEVSGGCSFLAGQHCSVQLQRPDGLALAREYSFSSSPSSGNVEITVARIQDGELSLWFNDEAAVGDSLQLSPATGNFCWTQELTKPVLLIGGGIGIAPLASMWREHLGTNTASQMQLVYSCRSTNDICFKSDLTISPNVLVTLTAPELTQQEWDGQQGRLSADVLKPLVRDQQIIYVCGSSAFVNDITSCLLDLGVPAKDIRRELFS